MTAFQVAKWERTVDVARSCGILVEPNARTREGAVRFWITLKTFDGYDRQACEIGRFATFEETHAFVCGYKAGMSHGQNTQKKGSI